MTTKLNECVNKSNAKKHKAMTLVNKYENDTNIIFECYGNPEYYYEETDEELQQKEFEEQDAGVLKPYTWDKMPGHTAFFKITSGCLECEIEFCTLGITTTQIAELIKAQLENKHYCIDNFRGYNEAIIFTCAGYTSFSQFGSDGDSPINIDIKIPNKHCIAVFQRLINN